jgi:two-component system OmpR family response regulator
MDRKRIRVRTGEANDARQLLVVDDESCTVTLVRRICEAPGILVSACPDCSTALSSNPHGYDLLLLDRKLSDGDGLTLCRTLRERNYRGPIVVFSQFDSAADQLRAFEAGADDFIPKMIEPELLRARIVAHMRRSSARLGLLTKQLRTPRGTIEFSALLQVVTVNGDQLSLTPLEARLFAMIADAYPEPVPRARLIAVAWCGTRASDHTLHNHISLLGAKLRSVGLALQSRRGEGYVLAVPESAR